MGYNGDLKMNSTRNDFIILCQSILNSELMTLNCTAVMDKAESEQLIN